MIIHLKLEDYLAMVQHARKTAPVEDCGLIGGRIDEATGEKFVEKVFFLTNTDHSEEHFSLDPKEQFAAAFDRWADRRVVLLGDLEPAVRPAHEVPDGMDLLVHRAGAVLVDEAAQPGHDGIAGRAGLEALGVVQPEEAVRVPVVDQATGHRAADAGPGDIDVGCG